jgi:hypothetical protein
VLTSEDFFIEILERKAHILLWQIREMSTLPSAKTSAGGYAK